MAMYDAIKNFHTQFKFEPVIENQRNWKKFDKFVVAGMGGSHLAADLLRVWNPQLDLFVHKDYGLPSPFNEDLRGRLIIASSYSGNTEEAIDAYDTARKQNMSVAAVSIGEKLLEIAKRDGVPYIRMPDTGIQPRSALGFSFKSILKLMGEERALQEVSQLAAGFNAADYEGEGKKLASRLEGFVPVIYASCRNQAIAYTWKIKFNETGKIPAFWNVFPELNHNEMTGFDAKESTRSLSANYYFIILRDQEDNPRILKRMEAVAGLLRDRKFPVEVLELRGQTVFHRIFSSLVLADWASFYIAEQYGVEAEQVPMVEELKKLIA